MTLGMPLARDEDFPKVLDGNYSGALFMSYFYDTCDIAYKMNR